LDLLAAATADPTSKGFVLMIEGSRIDMSAHDHDAGSHYYEIMQYQKTAQVCEKVITSLSLSLSLSCLPVTDWLTL
jgi:alkaline phosphatase